MSKNYGRKMLTQNVNIVQNSCTFGLLVTGNKFLHIFLHNWGNRCYTINSQKDNKSQKNAIIVINLAKQNKNVVFAPNALLRHFCTVFSLRDIIRKFTQRVMLLYTSIHVISPLHQQEHNCMQTNLTLKYHRKLHMSEIYTTVPEFTHIEAQQAKVS